MCATEVITAKAETNIIFDTILELNIRMQWFLVKLMHLYEVFP